jgi:hypothetical protein
VTIFEAVDFFRRLGTTWYDQQLDRTLRTKEMFARFREAEQTIDEPRIYRSLSREQGREVALSAFELYDTRTKNNDYLVHQILSNLSKFVPGALQGLYDNIIERHLYWGDGVTFREANQEVCIRLLGLLETNLEAQPRGSLLRADIVVALAWSESMIAVEAFQRWRRNPPVWVQGLSQPLERCTRAAGWELTEDGQKRYLYHHTCYELVPWKNEELAMLSGPVSVYTPSEERCPSCHQKCKFLFTIDVCDSRLRFLDPLRDQIKVPLCPLCEELDEEHPSVKQPLVLGSPRTPYETIGLYWMDGLSRIGGHPEWVQSPDYPQCTQCNTTMTFIAQLEITDIDPGFEGIAYAFLCAAFGTTATTYQCT